MITNYSKSLESKAGLSAIEAILIFIAFFIVLFATALFKKIWYWFRHKKRFYIIPRVSVKGISIIAMVISISIAIIILLTISTADIMAVVFRAWPGTRVTLEGILIKIGGLLFGPFIGIFIGGMTDLLTVALTAGVFHYGYLIAAMAYGLIGGLIKSIFNFSKQKQTVFAIYASILTTIIAIVAFLFLKFGIKTDEFSVSIMNINLSISSLTMSLIVLGFIMSTVVLIWICYVLQKSTNKRRIKLNKKPNNWFNVFVPVLVAVLLCEVIVNVLMMPSFDAELSSLTYIQWISIRVLLLIPMIFINMIVIYPIFKIVIPLVTYDYTKDLVESKKVPLFID